MLTMVAAPARQGLYCTVLTCQARPILYYANLPGKAAFLEELKDADINEMIPRIVAKIKEYERRKAAKALVARRLLTYVWRRRIRKLRELKKRADEQARRDAAMSI